MDHPDRSRRPAADEPSRRDDEQEAPPLTTKGSFGTALGASMLGLEQALRDGPPPQIQAVEHTPDRRADSGDSDLVIHFPETRTKPAGE